MIITLSLMFKLSRSPSLIGKRMYSRRGEALLLMTKARTRLQAHLPLINLLTPCVIRGTVLTTAMKTEGKRRNSTSFPPKRSLGQNFLLDNNIARNIVDCAGDPFHHNCYHYYYYYYYS